MDSKTLLVVCIALAALQLCCGQPVKRSCSCNLRGTDVCSCIPAAPVRPSRVRAPGAVQRVVYQKFAAPPLSPVGDVCTCNSGVIQPAVVPSIPCKVHPKPCDAPPAHYLPSPGDDCDGPELDPCEDSHYESRVTTYTIPAAEEQPVEELVPVPIRKSNIGPIPADAVSLAIAYDIATRQNKKIKEGVLNFGPMQKPADGFIKIKKTYVPEAGLHQLRNEVVELRAPSGFGKTCEDEAEASLLAAQDSCVDNEDTGFNGRLLTYNDLGFTSVKKPCNNFVQGSFAPSAPVVETVEYVVPAPRSAAPKASGYSTCDALATVERGRGSSGYDGLDEVARDNSYDDDEEEVVVEDDADSYAASGYPAAAVSSYGHGRARPRAPCSRSRTCTCGCNKRY